MTKISIPKHVSMAQEVSRLLGGLQEKVVLAESCTGGLVAATITSIEGVSNYFCGSMVTYRPKSKCDWLGVNQSTIDKCTTESCDVAKEMAIGALKKCLEANWGVAVVGHLGPGAPLEKDGQLYICIARRTSKGKIKIKELYQDYIRPSDRSLRQKSATESVLALFSRQLMRRVKKADGSRKGN